MEADISSVKPVKSLRRECTSRAWAVLVLTTLERDGVVVPRRAIAESGDRGEFIPGIDKRYEQ